MNIWRWLLTICGSLLALAVGCIILRNIRLRREPALLTQATDSNIRIPLGFKGDVRRLRQLEVRRQRDLHATDALIQGYERILRRVQPEVYPLFHAAMQNDLGNVYYRLPPGDRAANLERAIACYQEALRFRTTEMSLLDNAMTQNSLGAVYAELPTGDRAANLRKAITCFEEALRFYTPDSEPFECRRTTSNLAHLYFAQGAWDAALRVYRDAMNVDECGRAALSRRTFHDKQGGRGGRKRHALPPCRFRCHSLWRAG
jgi:tetratricopeptide (TPR) repeat protein